MGLFYYLSPFNGIKEYNKYVVLIIVAEMFIIIIIY